MNGTARARARALAAEAAAELLLSLSTRNVLQSGDVEGNRVARPPITKVGGSRTQIQLIVLPCSHAADSVVCLNVGGRIESKIVAGAHSGERRHRQSRGEESLQEFKPVSEWWDEIGAGKESFGVLFCQEGDQLGATAGGDGGGQPTLSTLFEIRFPLT